MDDHIQEWLKSLVRVLLIFVDDGCIRIATRLGREDGGRFCGRAARVPLELAFSASA
jgi:hypothetical protein